ncbi:unnamed protein product [Phytomonas sp. EM1]|nr:unnamed protein product [Phytomonas sp. EM1]|eukprot:CCW65163.1 unnamed protein product [Phytomonas sp. isolate EM1]
MQEGGENAPKRGANGFELLFTEISELLRDDEDNEGKALRLFTSPEVEDGLSSDRELTATTYGVSFAGKADEKKRLGVLFISERCLVR